MQKAHSVSSEKMLTRKKTPHHTEVLGWISVSLLWILKIRLFLQLPKNRAFLYNHNETFFNKFCLNNASYTKIGMIQKRLAWPLRKDDTQNREAHTKGKHIFSSYGIFLVTNMKQKIMF